MLRPHRSLRACFLAAGALSYAASAAVDFQREVRPILSENCFQCHGPDKNTRMADLRLDTPEGLFARRARGTVIAPGDPKSSLLVQRISEQKDALRMPPLFSKKTLSEQQKAVLRRWIEQGAPWKAHWS